MKCVLVIYPVGDEHKPYWCDRATIQEMVDEEWGISQDGTPFDDELKPTRLSDQLDYLRDAGCVFGGVRHCEELRAYPIKRYYLGVLRRAIEEIQRIAGENGFRQVSDDLDKPLDSIAKAYEIVVEYPNEGLMAATNGRDSKSEKPLNPSGLDDEGI